MGFWWYISIVISGFTHIQENFDNTKLIETHGEFVMLGLPLYHVICMLLETCEGYTRNFKVLCYVTILFHYIKVCLCIVEVSWWSFWFFSSFAVLVLFQGSLISLNAFASLSCVGYLKGKRTKSVKQEMGEAQLCMQRMVHKRLPELCTLCWMMTTLFCAMGNMLISR